MQRNHLDVGVCEYAGQIVDGLLLFLFLLPGNKHLRDPSSTGKAGLHSIIQFHPLRSLRSIPLATYKSSIDQTSLNFLFRSICLNFGDVHRSVSICIANGSHRHLVL